MDFKSFMSAAELGLFKNPGWELIQFYFVILVFIFRCYPSFISCCCVKYSNQYNLIKEGFILAPTSMLISVIMGT